MEHVGPFAFAATRFALGALTLLPILLWRKRRDVACNVSTSILKRGLVLGLLLFGGASLQQVGMVYTTAGKGGFITGLYIVIVPLLLAVVWREHVSWNCWLGAGLAVVGLFLLSAQSELQLAPGDGWVLASALVWALHVIAVGRFAPGFDPLLLAVMQYVVCSLFSGLTAVAFEGNTWGGVLMAWLAILYTGLCSIGIGYTLQIVAQRYTAPTHAAIILSLESLFAAVAGWLMLNEVMTTQMAVGAGLMLTGMILAQIVTRET
jgi:drug/metabolite transporter (DMT)-like permease